MNRSSVGTVSAVGVVVLFGLYQLFGGIVTWIVAPTLLIAIIVLALVQIRKDTEHDPE